MVLMEKKSKTKRLVVSAVMIGLAAVLSMIKVWKMPLGGSITLLSMLPICMLSIKYGVKWGLFSAFVYALVQIGLDLAELMSWGMTFKIWIGCIIFDYLLAYTSIGLAGLFKSNGIGGSIGGIPIALAVRFVCHVISGTFFFDIWCPDGWSVIPYSICYNGAYMLPEMIFTIVASAIIFGVPQTRKLMLQE
jgi:thiamine transporter